MKADSNKKGKGGAGGKGVESAESKNAIKSDAMVENQNKRSRKVAKKVKSDNDLKDSSSDSLYE